ncbi:MAG: hypothetical protein M1813_005613 [Trichoglossum hirsutum]|nr:MAG: hypothetical protein M1813_005613 [Trichoglossum hirsutum]
MKGFRQRVHEQLSRAKDSNKSSKKKDSSSGTSSPSSQSSSAGAGHTQTPVSSNHPTPTSSTTTLNDSRNKPLPSNENGPAGGGSHASQVSAQAPFLGPVSTSLPQHHIGNIGVPGALGSSSGPARHGGHLPPSVIISPSAPVSLLLVDDLLISAEGRLPTASVLPILEFGPN